MEAKAALKYLGAMLYEASSSPAEINRRIGLARHDLQKLKAVWKHAGISKNKKKQVVDACVFFWSPVRGFVFEPYTD